MNFTIKTLLFALLLSFAPSSVMAQSELNLDVAKSIPMLNNGRVKPVQTFAGESMEQITGRWNFEKQDPVYLLFSFLVFENWNNEPVIRVGYYPLKQELGLDVTRSLFSLTELLGNQRLRELSEVVFQKNRDGQDLAPIETELGRLMHRMNLLQDLMSGHGLTIVPPPPGADEHAAWSSILHPAGYDAETTAQLQEIFTNMLIAFRDKNAAAFDQHSRALQTTLTQLNPGLELYPTDLAIQREIFYNEFKPYLWACAFYLIAFIFFLVDFRVKSRLLYWSAFAGVCLGFVMHSYGFLLRSLIADRVPVANMYETVVYVSWAIILTAIIFEVFHRKRWMGGAGAIVGVGMMLMANLLPFDSNIEPLAPVLRSNYYLIIHVMTITFSYGTFALAMGLSHVILCAILFTPGRKSLIEELSHFNYRAIQIGVVLLAAGTILGGVWAAESWGRFWGWDPKETWSLISLLGYMVILHARYTGWLSYFGTAFSTIVAFQLIIFTWYGVNFILATGMHSYGFGSGGGWYIATYVIAETVFLGVIGAIYLNRNRDLLASLAGKPAASEQ